MATSEGPTMARDHSQLSRALGPPFSPPSRTRPFSFLMTPGVMGRCRWGRVVPGLTDLAQYETWLVLAGSGV